MSDMPKRKPIHHPLVVWPLFSIFIIPAFLWSLTSEMCGAVRYAWLDVMSEFEDAKRYTRKPRS